MRARKSVEEAWGWFVTAKGHYDLQEADTCACKPHIVGLLVECPYCGTVYGHLRESLNWGDGRAEGKHR